MSTRRIENSAACSALQVCGLAFCFEIKFTAELETCIFQENIKHLTKLRLLKGNIGIYKKVVTVAKHKYQNQFS